MTRRTVSGRDGVGQHPVALQVRQELVGLGVGEGHDVGAHRLRGRARSRASAAPRPRPAAPPVRGPRAGARPCRAGPAVRAPPARRPGACRPRAACGRAGPRRSRPRRPASSEPTGAHSPLDRQHMTVVAGRGPLGRGDAGGRLGVEEPRPVHVDGHRPGGVDQRAADGPATTGHPTPPCACSRCRRATPRAGGARRPGGPSARPPASSMPSPSSSAMNWIPAFMAAAPYS